MNRKWRPLVLENAALPDEVRAAAERDQFKTVNSAHPFVTKESAQGMSFSCWASRETPDLANEVVLASAFTDFIKYYENNPTIFYQHDHKQPIGRVKDGGVKVVTEGSEKGLWFDEVRLSDIPLVREVIAPLIRDRVLSQMSIGFYTVDGYWDDKTDLFYHSKVYMVETSVVSVACNPQAVITALKGIVTLPDMFQRLADEGQVVELDTVVDLHRKGQLSTIKTFGGVDVPATKETTPMWTAITKEQATLPVKQDSEFSNQKVSDIHIHADAIKASTFLICMEKEGRTTYALPIGSVTVDKGVRYEPQKLKIAAAELCGARNSSRGFNLSPEEMHKAFDRLASAYEICGMEMPLFADTPVHEIKTSILPTLTAAQVEFKHAELEAFENKDFRNALGNIWRSLERVKAGKLTLDEETLTHIKSVWGYMAVYVNLDDASDAELVAQLAALIGANQEEDEEEETGMQPILAQAPEAKTEEAQDVQEPVAKDFLDTLVDDLLD
ncbi:prohead protease [Microcystis phage Mvi-JY20]|uniref:Prohead protease n=1 Tax=Microcystis phage Mvi-JY20 TaxID=3128146 RepID=A0AAX4QHB2_9CAUD